MKLTLAMTDDAAAITALVNAAYRGDAAQRGWTHEAGLLEGQRTDAAAIRDSLAAGATILLLSDDGPDGALAGCVSVEAKTVEANTTDAAWYLGMLTIDPARQSDGLGRRLLDAAEDHIRGQGGRLITMTVIALRHTLIAWYERRGYGRTGETAPFPYGDERVGRPLRPDLVFVVLAKTL